MKSGTAGFLFSMEGLGCKIQSKFDLCAEFVIISIVEITVEALCLTHLLIACLRFRCN